MGKQCSYSFKSFSVSHSVPSANRLGWARGWEEPQKRQLTRTDQRHIPCHITSRSAIKLDRNLSKVATVQRPATHQSTGGRWRVCAFASHFLFPLLFFSPHLLNCLYLIPQVFSWLLLFWFSPPSAAGGKEQAAGGCLVVGQGQPPTVL